MELTNNKTIKIRHYTPEIEEFHVGFEYEYYGDRVFNSRWHKTTFEGNYEMIKDRLHNYSEPLVRVKYLNKEDIESLKWLDHSANMYFYDEDNNPIYRIEVSNKNKLCTPKFIYDLRYNPSTKEAYICMGTDKYMDILEIEGEGIHARFKTYYEWKDLFKGVIKNKSKLEKLMKQLGISEIT